eukprot:2870468-Amphidinium_carterae.2
MLARRCLGCGKKRKGKRNYRITCHPRLLMGLISHIEEGCVHDFFQGAAKKDMPFEYYVNVEDTMNKWWEKRQRAFVVYVSECGHRQSWRLLGSGDHGMCVSRGFQYFDTPAGGTPGKWRVPSDTHHQCERRRLSDHSVSLCFVVGSTITNWWTCCEYPIEHDTELIIQWTEMERLISEQSARYPDAVRNAREADYDMTEIYRGLREEMD